MPITLNPVITTNAAGTFSTTLDGMIQGMAMDDPAIRYQLTGGQLAPTEVLPMFGGVPIAENIPPLGVPGAPAWDSSLQNAIRRAVLTTAPPTGISVFNQNHAMISSVSSPVPQADAGMLVNLYRFGSRARIPLAMDPALVVAGAPVMPSALVFNVILNWVTNAAGGGAGAIPLPASLNIIGYNIGNSMTVAYDALTGFANWNRGGSCILLEI